MKLKLSSLSISLLAALSYQAAADESLAAAPLETIEVTGDFQRESLQTLSASASVLGEVEMTHRGASYLDELLNSTANVNFTAGASRGRFVQIRGVGLRSQFVDPITPSVGMLVDGINYSGLGGSALLFDIDQVTLYRGPQGTRFGADAMGGIIDLQSHAPTQDTDLKLRLGAGNYNSYEAGLAAGTGLTDNTAARFSVYQRGSDGYVDNLYLDKPTQDQEESLARFKLSSQLTDALTMNLVVHHIDINNGYDGFTLDNTRNSVANQPGKDTQKSDAFAISALYTGLSAFDIELQGTGLQADTEYSYDEDWTCHDATQAQLCAAGLHPDHYVGFDNYLRDHERGSLEIKLKDKQGDWVIGAYAQRRDVALSRRNATFKSHYDVSNQAVFGQKVTLLNDQTRLITGLRVERYDSEYTDSNGFTIDQDDTMVGGKLALEYQVVPRTMIYTSLSRGYKVGGANGEALAKFKDKGFSIPASAFSFEPEYLWNAEFGVKGQSEDKKHTLAVTAFYMEREDMQLKQWTVSGVQFAGFISNAGKGENYGLEIEGQRVFTDQLTLNYSLGYLDTKIEDFVTTSGENFDGREQAQSPKYQYAFSADYSVLENLVVTLGLEGKDDYFFSDSHNEQAPSQNLINASVSYYGEQWSLTAWGRNLADRDVPVRGFYIMNDPRIGYETSRYVQYGEPRVFGLTFTYDL
ncbi:TonB-dependent receptor [Pseudoalteromonas rubra]|uniref:TonB-dependent receptor n=1 Tax=Pseudoalteromonas rubra TaxID=43658 RepID=A0A5S3WQS1_9GAMM|nr:TonB-dependent receptor [Pseudoalteromonas rubra]TMP29884.1 TonB-dependent receptor [Pseudoalteromonas rubra]TMP32112.1 TonB-dependent receptor [Pseudoalteromonas rubra]